MNSTISIIIKNFVLLFLVAVSLVFIFSKNIGFKEINYLFAAIGFIYILASCYEAYAISQISQSANKIPYFTYGFLAKRFIKVIAFICCGVLLYASGSIIKYLSFTCFLISITEVIVIVFRYMKGLSYLAFDDEKFIISTNKLEVMFANDIQKIESRHGLTYFINHANKAFTVRTDIINDKELFDKYKNEWVIKNNIIDKVITP